MFLKHIGGNILYTGALEHREVIKRLKRAKLLVLASFFETTGLVGLEALCCGANVVITERGYTMEFFPQDMAYFCNPYSIESISEAMLKAFYRSVNIPFDFIDKYNWKSAAEETIKAYHEIHGFS